MPFDSNGTFSRVHNWKSDATAEIPIRADRHDEEDDNFAQGLSGVLTKDGRTQPTANLPMAGKKLTNLGVPTDPGDAATKAYADAVRNFNTSLTISGNDAQGRVNFTGTGTVGLSFTAADLGFGVRTGDEIAAHHRFVWNSKPDFSGTDGMVLTDDAQLGIGQVPPFSAASGVYATLHVTDQSYAMNCYYSTADSGWHFLTAGWAFLISAAKASGTMAIYRSSFSGAADAVIAWVSLESWNAATQVTFPHTVYAGGGSAYIGTDGNVAGSIWIGYGTGHSDAYTAISTRIENRAMAFVQQYAVTSVRSAGYLGYSGSGGAGAYFENSGYFMSGVQKVSGDSYNMYFRQPQVYLASFGGWVAFAW